MKYIAAMMHFFGKLPNETLLEFKHELDAVAGDRDFFITGLEQNGYIIEDK